MEQPEPLHLFPQPSYSPCIRLFEKHLSLVTLSVAAELSDPVFGLAGWGRVDLQCCQYREPRRLHWLANALLIGNVSWDNRRLNIIGLLLRMYGLHAFFFSLTVGMIHSY